jgi:hypothetical protein
VSAYALVEVTEYPTAQQSAGLTQETPYRALETAPCGVAPATTSHVVPFQSSINVTVRLELELR